MIDLLIFPQTPPAGRQPGRNVSAQEQKSPGYTGAVGFFENLDSSRLLVAKQTPSWDASTSSGPRPNTIGTRSQGEEELPRFSCARALP